MKTYLSESEKKATPSAQLTPPPTHQSNNSGVPHSSASAHSSTNVSNHLMITNILHPTAPLDSMDELLRNGQVLLHCSSEQASLKLPSDFWSVGHVTLTETLSQLFEQELHW